MYNFGIQEFKRLLKENNNLSKSDKNKAIKMYKKRISDRLLEIKKQLDEAQKERINNKVVDAPFEERIDNEGK